jgi:hypothetical protein
MATMTVEVKIFEPDGTTSRETYTEVLDTKSDAEMVIRNLNFDVDAWAGFGNFSFEIYKDRDNIDAVSGDIVEIWNDSVLRWWGKIDSVDEDLSDTSDEYEDRSFVTGRGRLLNADNILYSLIEADGGEVSTGLKAVLKDVFHGAEFTGKGQTNNHPIASTLNLINYTDPLATDNLPVLAINVSYKEAHAYTVVRDIIGLASGTVDLTSAREFVYYMNTNKDFICKQQSSSILYTFDIDDGEFPILNSDDLENDGLRIDRDTSGIYNYFTLNGEELTSLQYGTEVTASRSAHDIRPAPPLNNPNISIAEGQKWLDGFILDMLDEAVTYTIRPKKKVYGFSPPWFSGSTDIPDGDIKITEGGAGTFALAPFQSAQYSLDSSGWDVRITFGDIRPDLANRSRILTEFTGLGSFTMSGGVQVYDPSDGSGSDTETVPEFFDYVAFSYTLHDIRTPVNASDVKFIIRYGGGGDIWSGGTILQTFTSTTTPAVRKSGNEFILESFNDVAAAGTRNVNGNTLYTIARASDGNDKNYTVECEVTINMNGISYVRTTGKTKFRLSSETVNVKADDVAGRIVDAEEKLQKDIDATTGHVEIFNNAEGNAVDGGGPGTFESIDNGVTWTRLAGPPNPNILGTQSDSFEINLDDSSEGQVYLVFNVNSGSDKGAFEFDYNGGSPRMRFCVDFDEGTPSNSTWTDITSGATDKITKLVTATTFTLEVETGTGDLVFHDGTNEFLRIDQTTEDWTISGAIIPDSDGAYDLGSDTAFWADVYGEIIHTNEINESGDDWRIEWDGTNSQAIPHNFAIGFMDD